eukprot:1157349-Pelagomonas_calceolata.AAC.15
MGEAGEATVLEGGRVAEGLISERHRRHLSVGRAGEGREGALGGEGGGAKVLVSSAVQKKYDVTQNPV